MSEKPKTIFYKGVKYKLNRGYYKTTYGLHKRIWEDHFGEVPLDHHIHHKNGDSTDNRIENLECIHKKQHHSMHFSAIRQVQAMQSKEARAKRKKTDNLPENKEKFSKASRKGWKERKSIQGCCVECHKFFQTKNYSGTKVCSALCRSRRQRRWNTTKRTCVICGNQFSSDAAKTCSEKCRGLLISRSKKGLKYDVVSKFDR